ncbi:MAG TPA: hypothetical protein VN711_01050 [Candidatus Saccharimonadales bacterium]|nr:hypothetical protein [Candidatus Saccharimonadales bacterium]
MQQSRLSKTAEKKTKKQLYLSIVGIAIVVVVLFKYGIPALVNFSFFLSSFSSQKSSSSQVIPTTTVLQPPTLTTPFTATNSATIAVTGTALSNQTIQLYVNDSLSGTTTTKGDGSFTFPKVSLTQQQNTLKAEAKQGAATSNFSDPLTISYLQKAPDLTLDSPTDGQSFSGDQNSTMVKGKTDPDVQVRVNGFWAIVDNQGNYSYNMQLQDGDNHLDVVATDQAGNKTERQITVKYSH